MVEWEVWRTNDDGNRFLVDRSPDRVFALARAYALEAGHPHKHSYEVVGDRQPVVASNRDLYCRLLRLGEELTLSGRALLDYLCALWSVSRPLAMHEWLDGDMLAAMLTAAARARPVRPNPSWRVADFTVVDDYVGFADFTKVLCTQIADLLAFEETPPGPYAALGVDAPPRLDGGRATVEHWCNFDPASFLECATAGAFGGWCESDGRRVALEGPVAGPPATPEDLPRSGPALDPIQPLPLVSWGDVAAFLEYGQSYE